MIVRSNARYATVTIRNGACLPSDLAQVAVNPSVLMVIRLVWVNIKEDLLRYVVLATSCLEYVLSNVVMLIRVWKCTHARNVANVLIRMGLIMRASYRIFICLRVFNDLIGISRCRFM